MASFMATHSIALLLMLAVLTCSGAATGAPRLRRQLDDSSASSEGAESPTSSSVASSTPLVVNPVTTGYAVYGSRSGTGTSTYWSNNLVHVPSSLSLVWTLVKIFGPRVVRFFGNTLTLLSALRNPSPEPLAALAREASASLINSYTSPGFPLTPNQVLSVFNDALDCVDQLSPTLQDITQQFKLYNEAI